MSDTPDHFLVDLNVSGPLSPEELQAQRDFLKGLTESGRLLLAGVVPAISGRGMAILKASSLDDAKEIYKNAPVVLTKKAEVSINEFKLTSGIAKSL